MRLFNTPVFSLSLCFSFFATSLFFGTASSRPSTRPRQPQTMSPSAACASLKDAFPALTLLPTAADDEDPYQRSKDMLWSNTTILDPACIFAPATAEELGQGLARIVRLDLPFAVRCGGHMPNRGCNSIGSAGVMISLHELSSVEYAPDTGVARVGVGARWAAVYQALLPHKVAVAGGLSALPTSPPTLVCRR